MKAIWRLLIALLCLLVCLSLIPAAYADDGIELARDDTLSVPGIEEVVGDDAVIVPENAAPTADETAEEDPSDTSVGADALIGPETLDEPEASDNSTGDDTPPEELEQMIAEGFSDTEKFEADLLASGTSSMLDWKLYSDGLLTISGEGWMNDYTSTETSDWRAYKDSIKRVWISSGAASIGNYAFDGCTNLVEIHIPDSVTRIGNQAFHLCKNLTEINIPDSVKSIDELAFWACQSLTSVTIPDSVTSIGNGIFATCSNLHEIKVSPNNPAYCLDECSVLFDKTKSTLIEAPYFLLGAYDIPSSVTSINPYAFWACQSLTSVTIPDSVTTIGDYAFWSCNGLTSVTIPDSVTSIGDYAFNKCSSLTNVAIPGSVTSIGDWAFYNCSSLTSVTILDGVTNTGYYAFYNCTGLTSVTIPDSVTSIGIGTFYGCSSLTDVYFGGTKEEWNAITVGGGNDSLKNATIHFTTGVWGDLTWTLDDEGTLNISGSGKINDFAQGSTAAWRPYKNAIRSVMIEDGVTGIGMASFHQCINLRSVHIPSSVESIGNAAFRECSSLENLVIPEGVRSFGGDVFMYCSSLTSVSIPSSLVRMDGFPFASCGNLTEIKVDPDNPAFCDVDGILFTKNMSIIWQFPAGKGGAYTIPDTVTSIHWGAFCGCSELESVILPDGITDIGKSTFNGCSSLTELTLPDSVTAIGENAFASCSGLTSIVIPEGVTSIGRIAFYNCTGLTNVTIPGSVISIGEWAFEQCTGLSSIVIPEGVTSIARSAFYNCTGLTSVTLPNSMTSIGDWTFEQCSSLKSAKLPDSVTSIGSGTFSRCSSLTSVTIPKSVTSIGNYAFQSCSGLTDVYFGGTKEAWNAITVGSANEPLKSATIHFAPAAPARISGLGAEFSDAMTLKFYVKDVPAAVSPVFEVVMNDDNRTLTQVVDSAAFALSNNPVYTAAWDEANGRWEIRVKVFGKWLASAYTLRMYDGSTAGDPLPLKGYAYEGIGDNSVAAEHAYTMLDYCDVMRTWKAGDPAYAELYNAVNAYGGTMAQYWR